MAAITEGWKLLLELRKAGTGEGKRRPGQALLDAASQKVLDAGGTQEEADKAAAAVTAEEVFKAIAEHPATPEITLHKAKSLFETGTVAELPRNLSIEERAELAAMGKPAPAAPVEKKAEPKPEPAPAPMDDGRTVGPKKVAAGK